MRRRCEGLLGFALTVAFWPGVFEPAGVLRWIVIGAGVPLLLWGRSVPVTPALKWGAAFLAWSAFSLAWTFGPLEGADQLAKFLMLAGVFALGSTIEAATPLYRGLGIGLGVSSVIAVGQYFGWHQIDEKDHTPAGLFILGWVLASTAVPILIAVTGKRLWMLAALVAPAALLPMSRGPLLALVIVGAVALWRQARTAAIIASAAITIAAGGALYLHGDMHNDSLGQRADIWLDTADGLTFAGHGLGAFSPKFAVFAHRWVVNEVRPTHAHNDPLEMAFDLGLVGIVLFGAVVVACCRAPLETEHLVLLAILVESLTIFVWYQPVTAFLVALCLGRLAGDRYRLRLDVRSVSGVVPPRATRPKPRYAG